MRAVRGLLVALLVAGVLPALLVVPAGAATVTSDAIGIVKEGEAVSNVEIAARLLDNTDLGTVDTVVLGRDDIFADSLASASLQDESPLLLVPPAGPVPERVRAQLDQLNPSRVILLGGERALSAAVETELAGQYTVERRAGASRIETALDIAAQDAADATTAILARGFAGEGSPDPTQAFADVLAAGGWAADNGWPILFTQTDALPESVADYLLQSSIDRVEIMGGTAAVSAAVEAEVAGLVAEVERVAGPTRFHTAVEIAEKRGAPSAADVSRVTLVEGQEDDAWAGGFAAAAHSAALDAPIVLANKDALPAVTEEWLTGGGFAVDVSDGSEPVLTCVTGPEACEAARVALGLPPAADITFEPAETERLEAGATIDITVAPVPPAIGESVTVGGTCLDGEITGTLGDDGALTVTAAGTLPAPCTVTVTVGFPQGTTQTDTATYNIPPGSVTGQVVDAASGDPLAGARVTLDPGGTEVITAADGAYEFADLRPGAYTVTATADSYQQASSDVAVRSEQVTQAVLALSPALSEGELRIVLSWGEVPRDLDSHLWLPPATPYHLAYYRPGSLEACPGATLDVDDVNSFGPETVTISTLQPGRYRYAVNNFGGEAPLARSGAQVEVFDSAGPVASFTAPSGDATALWWHVFDFEDGTLIPVDQLLPTEPAPYADTGACAS